MITMRRPGRSGTPLGRLAWLLVATVAPATADDAPVTVLVDTDYAVTDVACPGNGQAIYGLDGRAGAVIAVDPLAPARPRIVVGSPPADGPRPPHHRRSGRRRARSRGICLRRRQGHR